MTPLGHTFDELQLKKRLCVIKSVPFSAKNRAPRYKRLQIVKKPRIECGAKRDYVLNGRVPNREFSVFQFLSKINPRLLDQIKH